MIHKCYFFVSLPLINTRQAWIRINICDNTSRRQQTQGLFFLQEAQMSKTFLQGYHSISIAILIFFQCMISLQTHVIKILISYE